MLIAYLITLYRLEKKMPVSELAKIIGCEYTSLWRFEKGKPISTSNWVKIIRWLLTEEKK